jgi:hypothetical protein
MTISTGDIFLPTIWAKDLLLAREAVLTFDKLVTRLDEDAADGGDSIQIDQLSNLAAYAKTASTIVTVQAPTETAKTLNINRHYESSFILEDRLKMQAKRAYNLLAKYAQKAGYAIGKQMDADIAALYADADNHVGDGSTAITRTNLLRAFQYLDDAEVPEPDRHLVGKPAMKAQLLDIDSFTLYSAVNSITAVRKAAIGDLYGADVWTTTQIVTESASPDVVHNMLFHRDAIALAVQLQPRVQFQYKQEYLGTLCTADSIWGYVTQRTDHIVDVRTKA